ncbi:hypothetical protein ACVWZR_008198 [Bradyrhizobium sp. i1.3.1]
MSTPPADLLVRREQDLDGAVLHIGVVDEEMRGIHDLGDAGLVVGAQERGAVGGDDVVADLVLQRGMFSEADHLAGIARQGDIAAAIVLHQLRLDVLAGHVGRGVHVRAEADHRHLLVGVGRDRSVDVAEVVEMRVGDAHGLQLGGEHAAEIFLFLGRGRGRGFRIGLGVDGDVAQEAFGHGVRKGEGGHFWSNRRILGKQGLGEAGGISEKRAVMRPERSGSGLTKRSC